MLVDLSHSKTNPVVEKEILWFINGVVVGCFKPAIVLKNLPGLDKLHDDIFKGKYVRQLGLCQMERQLSLAQTDHGDRDLSGFFVVPDAGAAVLFDDTCMARRWANNKNQINIENTPSLAYIDSGNANVCLPELTNNLYHYVTPIQKQLMCNREYRTVLGTVFKSTKFDTIFPYHYFTTTKLCFSLCFVQGGKLAVANPTDMIGLLVSHSKMKSLLRETCTAYVQRETGSTEGLARAVKAATAPNAFQAMMQRGSRAPIADGSHREKTSTSKQSDGTEVFEHLVERGVLLPDGQGIQIQQAQQQIVLSETELGKRKIDDEKIRLEMRLLNLQCDKLAIENEKQKLDVDSAREKQKLDVAQQKNDIKISGIDGVMKFQAALTSLDTWQQDRRLVLQTQDVLKNGFFGESPHLCIQNGSPLASITISQIANEMSIRLTHAQGIAVGRKVSQAYQSKHGKRPTQHSQYVDAAVRAVNSYTLEDRDMVVTAIQSVVNS